MLEVFEIVVVVCVFVEFVGFVLVWVEFELIVVVLLGVVEERVGMVFLVKVLFFFGIFVWILLDGFLIKRKLKKLL